MATTCGRSSPATTSSTTTARSSTSGTSCSITRSAGSTSTSSSRRPRTTTTSAETTGTAAAAGLARAAAQGADRVEESLDGGALGPERKLYLRELDRALRPRARAQLEPRRGEHAVRRGAARDGAYIRDLDPYDHHIVVHTYPDEQETSIRRCSASSRRSPAPRSRTAGCRPPAHPQVGRRRREGRPAVGRGQRRAGAGRLGVPPDPGYKGFDGKIAQGKRQSTPPRHPQDHALGQPDGRRRGRRVLLRLQLPENDLVVRGLPEPRQDRGTTAASRWSSSASKRSRSGDDQCRRARRQHEERQQPLVLRKAGEIYLVYLPAGGTAELDLSQASGRFTVGWFDPRNGGPPQRGAVASIKGGAKTSLGQPPSDPAEDWLVIVRAR